MIDPTSDPDVIYPRRPRGSGSPLSPFEQSLLAFVADSGPADSYACTQALLGPTISDLRAAMRQAFGAAIFLARRGLLEQVASAESALGRPAPAEAKRC